MSGKMVFALSLWVYLPVSRLVVYSIAHQKIEQIWTGLKLDMACLTVEFNRGKNLFDFLTPYSSLGCCRLD